MWDGGKSPGRQELVAASGGADATGAMGAKNWFSSGFGAAAALGEIGKPGVAPLFADVGKHDYRLAKADPAFVNAGASLADLKLPSTPGAPPSGKANPPLAAWQYKAQASSEERPDDGKPDIGAYENLFK